jgi:hypothetical protein
VQVADSDWDCVYGTASLTHDALPAGHYRWEIEYTGSAMPPVGADFEVR